jgi:hypothetical protein
MMQPKDLILERTFRWLIQSLWLNCDHEVGSDHFEVFAEIPKTKQLLDRVAA